MIEEFPIPSDIHINITKPSYTKYSRSMNSQERNSSSIVEPPQSQVPNIWEKKSVSIEEENEKHNSQILYLPNENINNKISIKSVE